ncbi:Lrp/AsnC family transcriptional regulator [Microbacterium sp. 18062]|uniref:Lrp/AsnC family transcriptional regulator n=1 Tax=Microbacterium sp. 18062 TaxID=2681410 RepID=UPI00135B9426|nr:Lrp/AsnC family transcriptional regulator [Microbacterium sp. 18062]
MARGTSSLDDELIGLLRKDGRASVSAVSRRLGVPRPLVRERLHRLVEDGHLAVTAIADPVVLGLETLCHLAVHVSSAPQGVARALAALPEASLVTITSGPHDVVVEIRSHNQRETFEIIARVREVPGITRVTTLLYVDVHKSPYSSLTTRPERTQLDALDRQLIGALQRDGRASYTALGKTLGVSESTARGRVKRLIDDHVIRITAVAKRNRVTQSLAMGLGINVGGDIGRLIRTLAASPQVEFVATSIGAFDMLATVSAASLEDLQSVVDGIRDEPEVMRVETWVHLTIVKESYSPARPIDA